MEKKNVEIHCPIFLNEEEVMEKLTQEINEAKSIGEKVAKAQELIDEVETLLSCEEYDSKNIDCKNCRIISNLRKETAEVVARMSKIMNKQE